MATGVNGHERVGPDTVTASRPHRDPHPLPADNAKVVLQYPGKIPEAEILAASPVSYTLVDADGAFVPCGEVAPNAVLLSDNFHALHTLLEQRASATLVYLDPPFATGMDFHSRGLEHAYADKLGDAAYLEFMRRRLVLLRELLTDDGSLYLHIGHQMVGHLKALLDEVFGPKCFRNIITRRKCSSKNFTSKQYANIHDYILFYTRSANYKWNQPGERPDDAWIEREYPKTDAKGRYKLVPVHAPGTRRGETGKPWRGKMPPPGKHWQYAPAKLDELDERGEIHWSQNGNPRRKVYLVADKLVALTDYWAQFRDAHHQSIRVTGYPTEKNLAMLRTIVGASSDAGDLVVDPFCGSGTTLEAAHLEQRRWIGIDESFAAVTATVQRLRHGTTAMGDYIDRAEPNRSQAAQMLFEVGEPIDDMASSVSTPSAPQFALAVDTELIEEHAQQIAQIGSI